MTRTSNRLIAFSFAVIATFAMQGTMLAGFDNLAQTGQIESQARAAASACTAANAHLVAANTSYAS